MRGYLVEAQWANDECVPAVNEYLQNGIIISTCDFVASGFLIGMKEIVWIRNNPKTVNASKLLGVLRNDIASHEVPSSNLYKFIILNDN